MDTNLHDVPHRAPAAFDDDGITLDDVVLPLRYHWRRLLAGPLLAGAIAYGVTLLLAPTYTARTVFLPPQQPQSAAASALAALGPLASLAGTGPVRSSGDQYVALMQSVRVSDRVITRFDLHRVYDRELRVEVRKKLERNVRIGLGKRDGLITVEVDDESPKRAAEMANQYVEELRLLSSQIALTEAQQRRAFFERQLQQSREKLAGAQARMQSSGFNQAALKSEPRAAAEGYAKLKAEVTAAEVRLQALRTSLADQTPEVRQQVGALVALREQLGRLEQAAQQGGDAGYVASYRDFKYQEALFDLFARQYESARVDESREGALIQVVDVASPPEKRSAPQRLWTTLAVAILTGLSLALWLVARSMARMREHNSWRESRRQQILQSLKSS